MASLHWRVQCDWNESDDAKTNRFWITKCERGKDDVNGYVTIEGDKSFIDIENVKFELVNEKCFRVNGSEFLAPNTTWDRVHYTPVKPRELLPPVYSVDVSQRLYGNDDVGYLGVSGSRDGNMKCWCTNSGKVVRTMNGGHVGDVNVIRWFPSDQIVLSGASDTTLRIWLMNLDRSFDTPCDAELISTLKGHALGITSVHMIDRGRNFVSSSRDGSVKIWDTSTSSSVLTHKPEANFIVNDCMILDDNGNITTSNRQPSQGNLVALVNENGVLSGFDRRDASKVFDIKTGPLPLNCIGGIPDASLVLVGNDGGEIFAYDVRKLKQGAPVFKVQKSTSPIKALCGHSSSSFWSSDNRGESQLWQNSSEITRNLSGNDLDPVHDFCLKNSYIYTASDDGKIRQYAL